MILRKCFYSIVSVTLLMMAGCESAPDTAELFRLEKQFWDVADYQNAVYKIESTAPGDKKPCYADPSRTAVFTKLVDKTNITVVLEDDALGVGHRADFASGMFDQARDMEAAYYDVDREDKFVYPMELVEVLTFGLYLQPLYFDLGNQRILQDADDPNEPRVQNLIHQNEQTLISNYTLYLDYVKQEKAFSSDGLAAYIAGMNEYFPKLIDTYPKDDFSVMREKASDMVNKAESPELKAALNNIIGKIDALKIVPTPTGADSLSPTVQ